MKVDLRAAEGNALAAQAIRDKTAEMKKEGMKQ